MRKINPLIKYYFYQLFNSIVFIVLNVLILVSSIITIILPYYLRCEFLNNCSFIIAIVFQLLIIIYLLFISIKLFNENKHNLSDVKLLGKNFFRNQMFWAKTIVITSCAIIVGLSMCILATFTMLGLHVNNNTIAAIFTSNFIGLVIDILVFTPILIILSLLLGRIWSPIISLLVVLIAPITSCISNFLLSNTNKCNNIDKNINDNSSLIQYDKIYQFDSNNKLIDSVYAYNVNFNQFANTNTNTDIVNSINYVNKFNYLIPGNITMAAQQAIYSKIDDNINLFNYLKYSGSLVRYVPNHFENLSNYINTGNSYILTNMNDNNFFNLNADQLNNMILNSVINVVNNHSSIANKPSEISAIYNVLKPANNNNGVWDLDKLANQKQIDFIFDLLGNFDSNLFYVWYYNQYLLGNISNIIGLISDKISPELSQLVNYLWFNNDTYFNLILVDSNNSILNEFQNKLRLTYPINFVYDSTLFASEKDINFFTKYLVQINNYDPNNVKVYILKDDGTYLDCDLNMFKSEFNEIEINNQEDWIKYLTIDNPPTVIFLNQVYNKLKNLVNNIANIKLQNQSFDIRNFNQIFTIEVQPYNSAWISSIVIELSIIFLFMSIAYWTNNKVRLS